MREPSTTSFECCARILTEGVSTKDKRHINSILAVSGLVDIISGNIKQNKINGNYQNKNLL